MSRWLPLWMGLCVFGVHSHAHALPEIDAAREFFLRGQCKPALLKLRDVERFHKRFDRSSTR